MKKNRTLIIVVVGIVALTIWFVASRVQVNDPERPLVGTWTMSGGDLNGPLPRKFQITYDGVYRMVVDTWSPITLSDTNIQSLTLGDQSFDVHSFKFVTLTYEKGTGIYNDKADGVLTLRLYGETAWYKKAGLFGK